MPDFNDVVRHVILRIVVDQAGLAEQLAAARAKLQSLKDAEKAINKDRVASQDDVTKAVQRNTTALDDNDRAHTAANRARTASSDDATEGVKAHTAAVNEDTKATKGRILEEAKSDAIRSKADQNALDAIQKRADRQKAADQALGGRSKTNEENLSKLQQSNAEKLSNSKKKNEETLNALQRGNAEKLDSTQRANAERLDSLQRGNVEKLDSLQRGNVEKLDSLQRGNVEKLDSARRTNAEKLDSLQRSEAEKLDSLQRGNVEKLDNLQRTNAQRLESRQRSDAEKLATLHDSNEERLAHTQLTNEEQRHNKVVSNLLREADLAARVRQNLETADDNIATKLNNNAGSRTVSDNRAATSGSNARRASSMAGIADDTRINRQSSARQKILNDQELADAKLVESGKRIEALEQRNAEIAERRVRAEERELKRAAGLTKEGYKGLAQNAQQVARAYVDAKEADPRGTNPRGSRLRNATEAAETSLRRSATGYVRGTRADGQGFNDATSAFFGNFKKSATKDEAEVVGVFNRIKYGVKEMRAETSKGARFSGFFKGLKSEEHEALSAFGRMAVGLKGVKKLFTEKSGGDGRGFIGSVANSFSEIADGLTSRTNNLGKVLFSFRGVIILALAALGPLAAVMGAAGAAALGLASDLGNLSGVVFALPGIIGAAVAGFGALALVMKPLSAAFQDFTAAQKAAKTATAEGSTAAKSAALDYQEALLSEQQAQLNYNRALDDAPRSLNKLTDARKDAARQIQDYRLALQKLKYDEEGAQLGVDSSEEDYRRSLADPTKNNLDRKVARHAVEGALFDKRDQQVSEQRLKQDSSEAFGKGVEGSDQVIDATRAVEDANLNLQQSYIALQKAILAMKKAQLDKNAGGTAAAALAADLAALPPMTRKVFQAFLDLQKPFKALRDRLSEKIFGPLSKDTGKFADLLKDLESFLSPAAESLGKLADKAIKLFSNADWKDFFSSQGEASGQILLDLGTAALSVANGFKSIVEVARPFTEFVVGGIEGMAKSFEKFSTSEPGRAKLAAFLDNTRRTMHQLKPVLKDFVGGLLGIFAALNDSSGANKGESFTDRTNKGLRGLAHSFKEIGDKARDPNGGFQTWLRNVGPLIKDVVKFLGQASHFFGQLFSDPKNIAEAEKILKAIGTKWLPALSDIFSKLSESGAISKLADGIGSAFTAISKFFDSGGTSALSVFATILESVGTIYDKLTANVPLLSKALAVFATVIAGIAGAALFAKFTGLLSTIRLIAAALRTVGGKGLVGTFDLFRDKVIGRDSGESGARRAAKKNGGPIDRTGTGGVLPHLTRMEGQLAVIIELLKLGGTGGTGGTGGSGGTGGTGGTGSSTGPRGGGGGGGGGGATGGAGSTLVDATGTQTVRRKRTDYVEPIIKGLPQIDGTGYESSANYLGTNKPVNATGRGITGLPEVGKPYTGKGKDGKAATVFIQPGEDAVSLRDNPKLTTTPPNVLTDDEKVERQRRQMLPGQVADRSQNRPDLPPPSNRPTTSTSTPSNTRRARSTSAITDYTPIDLSGGTSAATPTRLRDTIPRGNDLYRSDRFDRVAQNRGLYPEAQEDDRRFDADRNRNNRPSSGSQSSTRRRRTLAQQRYADSNDYLTGRKTRPRGQTNTDRYTIGPSTEVGQLSDLAERQNQPQNTRRRQSTTELSLSEGSRQTSPIGTVPEGPAPARRTRSQRLADRLGFDTAPAAGQQEQRSRSRRQADRFGSSRPDTPATASGDYFDRIYQRNAIPQEGGLKGSIMRGLAGPQADDEKRRNTRRMSDQLGGGFDTSLASGQQDRRVGVPRRRDEAAVTSTEPDLTGPTRVGGQYGSRPTNLGPVRPGQAGYNEFADELKYNQAVDQGKALPRNQVGPIQRGKPGYPAYSRYLTTTERDREAARQKNTAAQDLAARPTTRTRFTNADTSITDPDVASRRPANAAARKPNRFGTFFSNLRDRATGDEGSIPVGPSNGRFLGIPLPGHSNREARERDAFGKKAQGGFVPEVTGDPFTDLAADFHSGRKESYGPDSVKKEVRAENRHVAGVQSDIRYGNVFDEVEKSHADRNLREQQKDDQFVAKHRDAGRGEWAEQYVKDKQDRIKGEQDQQKRDLFGTTDKDAYLTHKRDSGDKFIQQLQDARDGKVPQQEVPQKKKKGGFRQGLRNVFGRAKGDDGFITLGGGRPEATPRRARTTRSPGRFRRVARGAGGLLSGLVSAGADLALGGGFGGGSGGGLQGTTPIAGTAGTGGAESEYDQGYDDGLAQSMQSMSGDQGGLGIDPSQFLPDQQGGDDERSSRHRRGGDDEESSRRQHGGDDEQGSRRQQGGDDEESSHRRRASTGGEEPSRAERRAGGRGSRVSARRAGGRVGGRVGGRFGSLFRGAEELAESAGGRGLLGKAGGLLARGAGGLARGLGGGLVGAALSGVAQLGGSYLTDKFVKNDADASSIQRGLGAVGNAAGIGATIGSIIPGVGTVVGGAIGGIAGGAYSLFKDKNLRNFVGGKISSGVKSVGGAISSGVKSVGSAIGNFFGGGDKDDDAKPGGGSGGGGGGGTVSRVAAAAFGPLGLLASKTDIGKSILGSLDKAGKGIGDFFTKTIPGFFNRGVKGIHDFFTKTLPALPGKAFDAITTGFGVLLGFFIFKLPKIAAKFFTKDIPHFASLAWDGFNRVFVDPIVGFIKGIPNFFTHTVPQWFASVGHWRDKHIVKPLHEFITKKIPEFFTHTIPKWFHSVAEWREKHIVKPLHEFITKKVPEFFTVTIPKWFREAPKWFKTHVIDNVTDFFTVKIPNFFTVTLPNAIKALPGVLYDHLVQPILDFFGGLAGHVGDFLKGGWSWAKGLFSRGTANVVAGAESQKMSGGVIEGIYQGLEDTTRLRATPGEFVIRRSKVQQPRGEEFLRDYNEGRIDPSQFYAGLSASASPRIMSIVPPSAAGITAAMPSVVNHTVNQGMSMGDITINNPVREKAEHSLRRQIQINAIRHRR